MVFVGSRLVQPAASPPGSATPAASTNRSQTIDLLLLILMRDAGHTSRVRAATSRGVPVTSKDEPRALPKSLHVLGFDRDPCTESRTAVSEHAHFHDVEDHGVMTSTTEACSRPQLADAAQDG